MNVKGTGGLAHYSWGLRIGTQNGGTASPTIIGGTFSAQGNGQGNYSEQTAITVTNIRSSSPTFDRNELIGPPCPLPGTGGGAITYLQNSAAVLTNNILRDQTCVDATDLILSENAGPMLINNTLQLATCAGCGRKRGLVVNGSTGAGSVRNNIFVNAGSADFTHAYLVYETNATSDLPFFENNALWAPNGGILYWDEGTTSLSLAAINGLMGSTANIHADPSLDATFHLLAASPCRNAGSAINAPGFDFDGDTRPREMSYDIGADEYVP